MRSYTLHLLLCNLCTQIDPASQTPCAAINHYRPSILVDLVPMTAPCHFHVLDHAIVVTFSAGLHGRAIALIVLLINSLICSVSNMCRPSSS